MIRRGVFVIFAFLAFLLAGTILTVIIPSDPAGATSPDTDTIPSTLLPWRPWVLNGFEESLCPSPYNAPDVHTCRWPSRLRLELGPAGGTFILEWTAFAEGWAILPGGGPAWPQDTLLDGKRATVVDVGGLPAILMPSGLHTVQGGFSWREMPETLIIPPETGLLSLSIEGKPVDFPLVESGGRLWLQKRRELEGEEDRTEVKVYRLIADTIPMRVTTLLRINVAGRTREVRLDNVLPKGMVPLEVQSGLPARLIQEGSLILQTRPGRHEVTIHARFPGPVTSIGPVEGPFGVEVWAFQPQNHLRLVEVEGLSAVDPSQTDMPSDWKRFRAFVAAPGETMTFKTVRRGDPDPAPDALHLARTWWLDFDGGGFTVQDSVKGVLSSHWSLVMDPPMELGRVAVDGQDSLITRQGPAGKAGVELRRGQLNLLADSRMEGRPAVLPAVGWDHDFQSLSGVLNLPPGWRLMAASGVDNMSGTWSEQWTLLDFFLVLVIAMAIFHLWDWRWGLLALVTMTLIYHETGAPRQVWLHLIAATALLRFLPEGRFRKLVHIWRLAAFAVLLCLAVPFMVQQIRWGVYPQLEPVRPVPIPFMEMAPVPPGVTQAPAPGEREERPAPAPLSKSMRQERTYPLDISRGKSEEADAYKAAGKAALTQDPKALIQTGPGVPSWHWRSLPMQWSGPVQSDQKVRLWLLSPRVNLILAFVRVLLLAALIAGLAGSRASWRFEMPGVMAGTLLAGFLLAPMSPAAWAAPPPSEPMVQGQSIFPPPELLQELRERLLKPAKCFPHCADTPRMDVELASDELRLLVDVHAATHAAVPLPGNTRAWFPARVLVDAEPAKGLHRDKDGTLWVLLSEGQHRVALSGRIPPGHTFQVPLPLKPHTVKVRSGGAEGAWDIQGLLPDGQVESTLQFTRREKSLPVDARGGAGALDAENSTLEPFLHVERVLELGLEWRVRTTVHRLTPVGTPVVAAIPLLEGESVTAAGIRVEKSTATVTLGPRQNEAGWVSSLKPTDDGVIRLHAPETLLWTETWILDSSPIWHCELSGIPVIHHQDTAGFWKPQWEPWPGEAVSIAVSRPEAVPGQLVTIDWARLDWTPGQRFGQAELNLRIRSSQGGQHTVTLPENASLQGVKINGKSQPISLTPDGKGAITLPLQPGGQDVTVEWHQEGFAWTRMEAPRVDVGSKAVNAAVTFHMPGNRWILWAGGPRLGPAVLFWSYLVVVVLAASALGRISWTSLKTWHWLLLGLGLTQVDMVQALIIVGWFLALGWRRDHVPSGGWLPFDMAQLLLAIWTVAALSGLYDAVREGLLGIPKMQIAGNNSSHLVLNWTVDRTGSVLPQPWVISLPLMTYRILMLFWALWLAQALLRWLRWGWGCFSEGGLWRKAVLRRRGAAEPQEVSKGEAGKGEEEP